MTAPRTPCRTFSHRMGVAGWLRQFTEVGRHRRLPARSSPAGPCVPAILVTVTSCDDGELADRRLQVLDQIRKVALHSSPWAPVTQLGAADVSDAQLARMVADLLHEDDGRAGRLAGRPGRLRPARDHHRPRGMGERPRRDRRAARPFRFFVKQVQAWERPPLFQHVPEEYREMAVAGVPWKTEAEVYRSDLADRLPDGPDGAARARRLRPRRAVAGDLARGGPGPPRRRGTPAPRARGVPARPALRRPGLAPLAGLRDIDWSCTPTRPAGSRCRWCRS